MFKTGCTSLGADTPDKWYKIIPDLKKELQRNKELFKKVYEFTFEFT